MYFFGFVFVFFIWHYFMFNLPDLNVTGFESKAYIRYYASCLFCLFFWWCASHLSTTSSSITLALAKHGKKKVFYLPVRFFSKYLSDQNAEQQQLKFQVFGLNLTYLIQHLRQKADEFASIYTVKFIGMLKTWKVCYRQFR